MRSSARAVVAAAAALVRARRPLIIAGRGTVAAGARYALERLADQLRGPAGNFGGGQRSIHRKSLVGECPNVRGTVLELLEGFGDGEVSGPGCRTPEVAGANWAGSWRNMPYRDAGTDSQVDPRTLTIALDDTLPSERTVVTDSSHLMGFPAMSLRVPDARDFVFTQAFQAVGLRLVTAIGAVVAAPGVGYCGCPRGWGALMGLSDLEKVARLDLKMAIVVYNDAAYRVEVHHFGPQGWPLETVRFPNVDFAALARAVGLEGITVRRVEGFTPLKGWGEAGMPKPVLADAEIAPTAVAEWLEEAFRGHCPAAGINYNKDS